MKALFCEVCYDVVKPIGGARGDPRFCICRRHAIWGLDDDHNEVRVFDRSAGGKAPADPHAYVLLISNNLLELEGSMRRSTAAALIAEQGDNWFRATGSLIVRVRPGEHARTEWSDLPPGDVICWGTGRATKDEVLSGALDGHRPPGNRERPASKSRSRRSFLGLFRRR